MYSWEHACLWQSVFKEKWFVSALCSLLRVLLHMHHCLINQKRDRNDKQLHFIWICRDTENRLYPELIDHLIKCFSGSSLVDLLTSPSSFCLYSSGDDLMRCVDLYNQTQSKWFEEMVTSSMVILCLWSRKTVQELLKTTSFDFCPFNISGAGETWGWPDWVDPAAFTPVHDSAARNWHVQSECEFTDDTLIFVSVFLFRRWDIYRRPQELECVFSGR